MKKFLTFTLVTLVMMVFVACGSSEEETQENNDSDNIGTHDIDTPDDTETTDGTGISDTDTDDSGNTDDSGISDIDISDDSENTDDINNDNDSDDNGGSDETETPDIDTPDDTNPDSDECVPQCDGKDCGEDGCGGSCGTCGHDQGCSEASKCVDLDFSGCVGLSVDWEHLVQYAVDKFYAVNNGGSDPRATIQFAQNIYTGEITPGTYDLGSEINSHYKTCTECILVYSDLFVNASGYSEYAKKYFQHDGTLVVGSVDEENRIKGTLTARILEATMDNRLMTNFVSGGTCFEIESALLDTPAE